MFAAQVKPLFHVQHSQSYSLSLTIALSSQTLTVSHPSHTLAIARARALTSGAAMEHRGTLGLGARVSQVSYSALKDSVGNGIAGNRRGSNLEWEDNFLGTPLKELRGGPSSKKTTAFESSAVNSLY